MAAFARSEDLVRIGAYKPRADEEFDRALKARAPIRSFLTQRSKERVAGTETLRQLARLAGEI
jgi:flagellum-specific ATP synthase